MLSLISIFYVVYVNVAYSMLVLCKKKAGPGLMLVEVLLCTKFKNRSHYYSLLKIKPGGKESTF